MTWLDRLSIAALTLLTSAIGATAPARAADASATKAASSYDLPFLLDKVSGGPLTDQAGRPRTGADFADKLVAVELVTTRCPSLCAIRSVDLSAVAKALPEDVRARLRFIAISIDPADKTADLAGFADGLHLDTGHWTLLATDAGEAARIEHAIGQRILRPGEDAAEPATNVFLFDRRGRLMQSYGGRVLDRGRLTREIVALDQYDATLALTSKP